MSGAGTRGISNRASPGPDRLEAAAAAARYRRARAFSLAELMIALIILAFGLMVIGAALPIGLRYTQQIADETNGEAAAEYALDLIAGHVRLSRDPYDELGGGALRYTPDVFQPRDPTTGRADDNWEPLLKVRPLPLRNVVTTPGGDGYGPRFAEIASQCYEATETAVGNWLAGAASHKEYDAPRWWVAPALASVTAAYPPISADRRYYPDDFFGDPYATRMVRSPVVGPGSETVKAARQRIVWTAFYRRVSYQPGSDPQLYEFITVACRLPSARHRFPRLTGGAGFPVYNNGDTMAPVPWLVTFVGWDAPPAFDLSRYDRILVPGVPGPAKYRFYASADVARLLGPGSILVPAVNDERPDSIPGQTPPPAAPLRLAGFVPHAPDALPIYEVERTERLDTDVVAVVVKPNGYYPWTIDGNPLRWPVWIIPPAFQERDSAGQPVYEKRSPIVGIARRYVRLTEIP